MFVFAGSWSGNWQCFQLLPTTSCLLNFQYNAEAAFFLFWPVGSSEICRSYVSALRQLDPAFLSFSPKMLLGLLGSIQQCVWGPLRSVVGADSCSDWLWNVLTSDFSHLNTFLDLPILHLPDDKPGRSPWVNHWCNGGLLTDFSSFWFSVTCPVPCWGSWLPR